MRKVVITFIVAMALVHPGCGQRDESKSKVHKGALHQYRLGASKYREGDFEDAIRTYEKALQLDPNLAAAHLDLGIIYDDYRSDKKEAIVHYKEYLRLEPKSEKAEMVMRWIHSAEEEKADGAVAQAPASSQAAGAESEGAQAELQQAQQDIAALRTEKDAYLKTVEALREELSQAKQQMGTLLAKGQAQGETKTPDVETDDEENAIDSLARKLAKEKAQLLERYRLEKGQVEKTIEALRGEITSLQAQKKASDEALKKSNERFEALKKAAFEEKGDQAADDALKQKLALVNEKCAELQREGAIYLKDNKALLARLKKAERDLEEYRKGGSGTTAQAAQVAAPLIAKVKADAERDKEELRQAYERKLRELTNASARQKAALQKALAESQREASTPQTAVAPAAAQAELEKAVARMKAESDREKEELRLRYERKLNELSGALGREKIGVQRELADTRREALYFKTQVEREKEKAARSDKVQADAIRRLKEQHRIEKAELEKLLRQEKAKHSGARAETQVQAPVRRYKVARGDSLQSISRRFYGTADRWKTIYNANRAILSSPKAPLRLGEILTIP